jgi:GntR family transcriptional regulator
VTADREGASLFVENHCGDADRVFGSVGLGPCVTSLRLVVYPSVGVMDVAVGIDPSSDRPVFRQIADWLRSEITSGKLAAGAQLPSESELVGLFNTTRTTARQALTVLKSEGLIVSEHGRGAFVRRPPTVRRLAHDRFARRHRKQGKAAFPAEAETGGFQADVEVLRVGRDKATPAVAARLGLRSGTAVLVRHSRYLADGHPVEVATSYIPWAYASGTAMTQENTGPGGIYARLDESGHRLARFTEEVTARMPTPDEVKALRLDNGVPVIALIRTAIDNAGIRVEVCDTVMAADRFVLEYELPAR